MFVTQAPRFKHAQLPTHVCRLRKARYGLKQSPWAWYDRFSAFRFEQGFKSSTADPSLFVLKTNHDTIILVLYVICWLQATCPPNWRPFCLLLYVHGMLITYNVSTQLEAFMSQLKHEFSMTDLGHMHYFLGVKIDNLNIGFFLSQRRCAAILFLKAGLQDCKPLATPMATKLHPPDDSCFSWSFTLSHNCWFSSTPHLYKARYIIRCSCSMSTYTSTHWFPLPTNQKNSKVHKGDDLLWPFYH